MTNKIQSILDEMESGIKDYKRLNPNQDEYVNMLNMQITPNRVSEEDIKSIENLPQAIIDESGDKVRIIFPEAQKDKYIVSYRYIDDGKYIQLIMQHK